MLIAFIPHFSGDRQIHPSVREIVTEYEPKQKKWHHSLFIHSHYINAGFSFFLQYFQSIKYLFSFFILKNICIYTANY